MEFNAALLAGGRSTRMSCDKAFLDWHGRPLWRVQVEKLTALRPAQLFIAARAEQEFAALLTREPISTGITCVNDPAGEDCGPIGAITRCLRVSSRPLLVLAADMPAMTVEFLQRRLLPAATATKGAVWRGPRGCEALAAVYVPAALPFFEAALSSGRLALQPLVAEIVEAGLGSIVELPGEHEPFFANANTPEEAARLLSFPNQRPCA